jgi:hypothetical protein
VSGQLDKFLQQSSGSQIASQEAIASVVGPMLQTALQARDDQLQQIVNQVATKLQQLEAAIGQVALAAQQTKLSPFEVALKALPLCGKNTSIFEDTEGRCYDKCYEVIERWLDAALATSEAGDGDARRAEASASEAEAETGAGEAGAEPPPVGHQAEAESTEND